VQVTGRGGAAGEKEDELSRGSGRLLPQAFRKRGTWGYPRRARGCYLRAPSPAASSPWPSTWR